MSLLDELARQNVPPAPEEFDRDLHQRINRVQSALHLGEFLLLALPAAGWQLLAAVASAAWFTVSGQHLENPERRT